MSGQRPPRREDAGHGFPAEEGQRDADARLAEVSAALAALPDPALPGAVEERISGAIAAEAAARAAAGAAARRPRLPGRARGAARRRPGRRRLRPAVAIGSIAACLVAAAVGSLLALHGAAGGPSPAAAPAASAGPEAGSAGGNASRPFLGQRGDSQARPTASSPARFLVVESGTSYSAAALASQVRAELARAGSLAGQVPPAALAGCVLRVTGGAMPSLVDRASYDGRAAYIIAVPGRAWVAGAGCTAADPRLIASVSLTG